MVAQDQADNRGQTALKYATLWQTLAGHGALAVARELIRQAVEAELVAMLSEEVWHKKLFNCDSSSSLEKYRIKR